MPAAEALPGDVYVACPRNRIQYKRMRLSGMGEGVGDGRRVCKGTEKKIHGVFFSRPIHGIPRIIVSAAKTGTIDRFRESARERD